tara:strand:+ start:618 stop:965 length:348 start_codon:yes stop_codon:yes gene_type:complete
MNLNEQRIQEILSAAMKVGKRYEVRELIELFESTYTKFTSWDTEPVPSEPQRPRWHRLVTNAVRRSPDNDDYSDNSWVGLRTRKMARIIKESQPLVTPALVFASILKRHWLKSQL